MEFILVHFDPNDIRDVIANASTIGETEKTLMLDSGFYEITLSGTGFTPDKWEGPIDATAPTDPLSIVFTRIPAPPSTSAPEDTKAKKAPPKQKKRGSAGV
jgi:hypothetical protein